MHGISRPWFAQAKQSSTGVIGNKSEWLYLCTIIALGVALRWQSPAMKSDLWYDEVYSYIVAGRPFGSMLYTLYLGADTNPPLYTVLLHFWLRLGDSDTHIKLLSLLFAVASMPVLYLLAKRIGGRVVALFACLLFAGSQSVITYSVEARPYSLFLLLSLLSTHLLLSAIDGDFSLGERLGSRKRLWFAYSVVTALALYTHWFGLLLIFVQATVLVIYKERARHFALRFLVSIGLIGILCLPLAPFLWTQIRLQSSVGGYAWPGKPGLAALIDLGGFLGAGRDLLPFVALILLRGYMAGRKKPIDVGKYTSRHLIFFATYVILPVIVVFTASRLLEDNSFFVRRYFLPFIIGVHILLALALSRMNRTIAVAAMLVLVLFPVAKAVKRWRNPETPYSRLSAELPADCSGDVLVAHLSPMSYYPALHYRRNEGTPEKILCAKSMAGYEVSYNLKGGMLTKEDLIEVGAGLHEYRHLWLVIDPIDKDNGIIEAYDSIKNDKSLVLEAVKQVIGLRVERYRVVDESDQDIP